MTRYIYIRPMKRYVYIGQISVIIALIVGSIAGFLWFVSWLAKIGDGQVFPDRGEVVREVSIPDPTDYAVDTAMVLSEADLNALNVKLKSLDTQKHQFGVAIVKTTKPLTIEEFGIKLAEKWKVGHKGLDNGAIIIIATEDRKVRIEVGYGLEGDIPDSAAGGIIRNDMTTLLKQARWKDAVVAGLDALNSRVR